jgi:hypothetical protein
MTMPFTRRFVVLLTVAAATFGCRTTTPPPTAAEALGGPIRVFVWHDRNGTHEPIPGARVFALDEGGAEVISVLTNAGGAAELPNHLDNAGVKYLFAELPGAFYVTGLRWSPGRREYNLPLHVVVLVNRATAVVRSRGDPR